MRQHVELGKFLQTRRARLRPDDVGLPTFDEQRRVPGLRREELARLAGVSSSYYTRLEQGQSLNASSQVLDALAEALQLDHDERAHLLELARPRPLRPPARPRPERVAPEMSVLMAAMRDVPAVLTGRRGDIVAWNALGHALYAGHLDPSAPDRPADRPNVARLIFTDHHTRALYADWRAKAGAVVAHLRLMAGRHPGDPVLAALIGELTMHSSEFATLWADHRVRACDTATYELHHPLVGALTVTQQALTSPAAPDHSLSVVTAAPGSPSEAALVLLQLDQGPPRTTPLR